MKLKKIQVDGFRSVREPLNLFIDPKVTILIGANDHGKTTLLEAIKCLNDDRPLTKDDENWDSVGQGKPIFEFEFTLDQEETAQLKLLTDKLMDKEHDRKVAEAASAKPVTVASSEPDPALKLPAESLPALAIPKMVWDYDQEPISTSVKFTKTVGQPLVIHLDAFLDKVPEAVDYLTKRVPRIELFAAVPQLLDVVTLEQLELPDQEFMQGIFRYADIWEGHAKLFKQDPATTRRLQHASEVFTEKIRREWKQGENLSFSFNHAGQNGNQIELLIRDPAVSQRYVRPSERSGDSRLFSQ